MKKFSLILFGFVIGVIIALPFVPEFTRLEHTIDTPYRSDPQADSYAVTKIIDGDTIDVRGKSGEFRIRIIGIDTPETVDPRQGVECEGPEASARMKALLSGKAVTIERKPDEDKDRYGRYLRYVYLDDEDVGALMLREGLAESICDAFPHPKCDAYEVLERTAREGKRGKWSACTK